MSGDNKPVNGALPSEAGTNGLDPSQLSSKDYYFDSYAHFGIHEVGFDCFKKFIYK